MDIQIIHDDAPASRLGITGDQPLKVLDRIRFGPRWPPGWRQDLARDDIEIDEPGEGAIAHILKLAPPPVPGLHRQVGMCAFERLHAGEFIATDRSSPALARSCAVAYSQQPSRILSSRCSSATGVNQYRTRYGWRPPF